MTRLGPPFKWNIEKFIEKSKEIHGAVYDYSKSVYIAYNEKLTIICRIHGEFEQSPAKHLSGQGCQKCKIINGGVANSSKNLMKN